MKNNFKFTLILGFFLSSFGSITLKAGLFLQVTDAPQGETSLIFNNSANTDILVASTCNKNPEEQGEARKGQQAKLQLKLGAPCKIIALVKEDPTAQAVMCIDEWGCQQHCLSDDPECANGACDTYGIVWVRGCGGGKCLNYKKPGLTCGKDNCDICVRGANNSLSYGIALRFEDLVARMVNGGNIRFALFSILGKAQGQMMIDKIGMAESYDFGNAAWKITELNYYAPQTKDGITNAFCNFVVNDPTARKLYNEKSDDRSRDTFKNLCPEQYKKLTPQGIKKGDDAGHGYVWNNPPSYAVKCGSGAYLKDDKSGCECPAGKKLISLPVDISLPGANVKHWGCQ